MFLKSIRLSSILIVQPPVNIFKKLNVGTVALQVEIPIKHQGTDKFPIIYVVKISWIPIK